MDEVIRLRIESKDKEAVEIEAKKLGISVSAFIRLLIRQWNDGIRFEREKTERR